jgi:hypothetical protein
MNDAYYPKDNISRSLLASVPRKVYVWLMHLDAEMKADADGNPEPTGRLNRMVGNFGRLAWDFASEQQSIMIEEDPAGTEDTIRIWWCDSPTNPNFTCGTEKWMEDISNHLPEFMRFEKRIYDQLEVLAASIDEHNKRVASERNLSPQAPDAV